VEALQEFVDNFTYLGIFAGLLLGSLGVPIPEEMPIIAAAVLSHEDIVQWWLALPVCLLGVLSGDMVLYWVGRHSGEQVLNWRLVRLVLSPAREHWLKAAYRRHALKTVVTARHVMGLRAAAFLTAGIARVPFWKFVAADAGAAILGVRWGSAWRTSSQIGSKPSWPMFTGQSVGLVSPVSWRLRRWWSSACGDGVVASGRSGWTRNRPRGVRRHPERLGRRPITGSKDGRSGPLLRRRESDRAALDLVLLPQPAHRAAPRRPGSDSGLPEGGRPTRSEAHRSGSRRAPRIALGHEPHAPGRLTRAQEARRLLAERRERLPLRVAR